MPGKQPVPSCSQWAFISVVPLGLGPRSLCMDSRANPALEPSESSLMWFCTAAQPQSWKKSCLLSLWPNSCMENWGNDLYVVSSSDRCTRSWLPPAPGLIGSLSLPLYNRELSGSMTRQTIQSFGGGFTLERGRSDTGGAPRRSRPDTDENSDSQGLGGNRSTLASGI